jgi:CRP/FNR family cyclic AMP-dependent transcriptional regulator
MVPYRLLQGFDLFKDLNEDELKAVADLAHEESFEEGEVIFQEGTEARRVYLLLEGRVALRFRLPLKPPSRETTIDTMSKGEAFGWSALVKPHRLTATAICSEPAKCLAFEREDLQRLFDENNHIGYVIMVQLSAVIASRLRDVRLQLIRETGQSLMYGW